MADQPRMFKFDGSLTSLSSLEEALAKPFVNASKEHMAEASAAGAAELASLKVDLQDALVQYPDFPSIGVTFEDIMPLFAHPKRHAQLNRALHLMVMNVATKNWEQGKPPKDFPDVIVALESRGFLIGPMVALKFGAAFVPVRKYGKLPGPCETVSYDKEYGKDRFQMQKGVIKPGQSVYIVDDILATGGSAAAAGQLVRKMGGDICGYFFMMELEFLKGRDKLDAPVYVLFGGQEEEEAKLEEEATLEQETKLEEQAKSAPT